MNKFYIRTCLTLILTLLSTSPPVQANGLPVPVPDTLQLPTIDQMATYLIAGFSLGIIVYNGVISWCTRETIYLRFAIALFSYTIGIGQWNSLWRIPVWSQESVILVINTLNLILFIAFCKHFLMLFVDFKRAHPFITLTLNIYIVLASLLIMGYLLVPHPAFISIKKALIALGSLTCLITCPIWYPTIRNLRAFVNTLVLFCLLQAYFQIPEFAANYTPDSLANKNLIFFSGVLLFLSFSLLITKRINNDRKQYDIAQKASIHNLGKYQALYENALEGLFTIRYDGRILTANSTLNRLLKLPADLQSITSPAPFLHAYFAEPHIAWNTLMRQLAQQATIKAFEVQGQGQHWYSLSIRQVSSNNTTLLEGSLIDITQRKQQELHLAYLASHDSLTKLFNRDEFTSYLQDAISRHDIHTLLFIDLDQFKAINDTCGHAAGDECLRQVAEIFKQHTGSQDRLARLGGDEFGIVFWGQNLADGQNKAEGLRHALENHHFQWLQRIFKTTISIGLVTLDKKINCPTQALSLADAACYEAKDAGRNRVIVNGPDKHTTLYRSGQMDMVATLTQALKDNQLTLFRQPIVALLADTPHLQHFEVLLRLHTATGLLSPSAFLPAAQRYNLLNQIDRWVFNKTCQWLLEGDNLAHTSLVNINLSPQTLSDPTLIDFINDCLTAYPIPAEKICFEVTENSALNNFTRVLQHINTLRDLGFSFALDDFGTGFASFDHVRRLPVDVIKIDGQFIRNITHDANNKTIVRAITDIAHNLGKTVVAEWVEDTETVETLRQLGVDRGQGFHLGAPVALYVQGSKLGMQPLILMHN
jgi:diguanylate cyclase (GGDEF)-like protein